MNSAVVVVIVAGVVITVAIAIYRAWRAARATALAAPCALFTPSGIIGMFPDECLGTCRRGTCKAAGTRPYFIFWTQDIGPCTCPPPTAGTGSAPGTGTAGGPAQEGR